MKIHLFVSLLLGLIVGFVVIGCSEKVETEEKQAVVEEEVKHIDPILANRLRTIFIPRIDFEDVSLEQARDFILLRAGEVNELENSMSDYRFSIQSSADNPMPVISELRLRNVPISAVLRYICLLTEMEYVVDSHVTFIPKNPNAEWDSFGTVIEEKGDTTVISQKLSQIRLPRVDFENTSIHEAIDFLRLRSAELDVTSIDAGRKGINFVLYIPKGMETPYIDKLQIRDASFEEVLKEICSKTGMRYELDAYSVILIPKDLK